MGKSVGAFQVLLSLKKTSYFERKGGGRARAPLGAQLLREGFSALSRPGRCWPRPSGGRTVPAGRGPSGNSTAATWATCVVGPAGANKELARQSPSGGGTDRKEEEGGREREGKKKTTHNKTTASELAPCTYTH